MKLRFFVFFLLWTSSLSLYAKIQVKEQKLMIYKADLYESTQKSTINSIICTSIVSNTKGYPVDTIHYDDDASPTSWYSDAVYWGVKFTPQEACSVRGGMIYRRTGISGATTDTMYIREDDNGLPGAIIVKVPFDVPAASNGWFYTASTGNFLSNGQDFWITYYAKTQNIDLEEMFVGGDATGESLRTYISSDNQNWSQQTSTDVWIRAVVKYLGHTPNVPTITKPFDNIRVPYDTIRIWLTTTDQDGDNVQYQIVYDTFKDFSTGDTITIGTYISGDTISYVFTAGVLLNNHTYFYKVRASDPNGSGIYSNFSEVRSFTINISIPYEDWYLTRDGQFEACDVTGGVSILVDSLQLKQPTSAVIFGPESFDGSWVLDSRNNRAPVGWRQWFGINNQESDKKWFKGDLPSTNATPYGEWAALHKFQDVGGNNLNNMLESPRINLIGVTDVKLHFALWQVTSYDDTLFVEVSGDSGDSSGNWTVVQKFKESSTWAMKEVDISNWDGWSNTRFGFRYRGYGNAYYIGIDTVTVTGNVGWGEVTTMPIAFTWHPHNVLSWDKIIWRRNLSTDSIQVKLQYKSTGEWKDATNLIFGDTIDIYRFDPEIYDTIRLFIRLDHKGATEPVLRDICVKWDTLLRCIIDSVKENSNLISFQNDTLYYGASDTSSFTIYVTSIGADSVKGDNFAGDKPIDTSKPFTLFYDIGQGIKEWGWLKITSYYKSQIAKDSIYIMCDTLPPTGVALSIPGIGDTDIAIEPILWVLEAEDPLGIAGYHIKLDTSKDFNTSALIETSWTEDTMIVLNSTLKSNRFYWWYVRAKDHAGNISIFCSHIADVGGADSFKTANLSIYIDSITWYRGDSTHIYSIYPWRKIYYRNNTTPYADYPDSFTVWVSSNETLLDSVVGTGFGEHRKSTSSPHKLTFVLDLNEIETEIVIKVYKDPKIGIRSIPTTLDNSAPTNLRIAYPHYSTVDKTPRDVILRWYTPVDAESGLNKYRVEIDTGHTIILTSTEYQKTSTWIEDTFWQPTPPLKGAQLYTFRVKMADHVGNEATIEDSFITQSSPYFWTGAVNNDWHTKGNWDPQSVPINTPPYSAVYLQNVTNKPCIDTFMGYADKLIIEPNCTLFVDTFKFNFHGNVLVNNGVIQVTSSKPDTFIFHARICTLRGKGRHLGWFKCLSEKVIIPAGCTLKLKSGQTTLWFENISEFINNGYIYTDQKDNIPDLVFNHSVTIGGNGNYNNIGIKIGEADTATLANDLTEVDWIQIGEVHSGLLDMNGHRLITNKLKIKGKLLLDAYAEVICRETLEVDTGGELLLNENAMLKLGTGGAIIKGKLSASGVNAPTITSYNPGNVYYSFKFDSTAVVNVSHLNFMYPDSQGMVIDSGAVIQQLDNIYFENIRQSKLSIYLMIIRGSSWPTKMNFKDTLNGLTFDPLCDTSVYFESNTSADTLWMLSYGGTKIGDNYDYEINGVVYWGNAGNLKWVYPPGAKYIDPIYSTPVIRNHRVYIGSESGKLYCIKVADGDTAWTYQASGAIKGLPSIYNDTITFGTMGQNSKVYCLVDTGKRPVLVWTYDVAGAIVGTPISDGDFVYFGATDGKIYACSIVNGNLAWSTQYNTGGSIQSSPSIYSGELHIGSDADKLIKIQCTDGTNLANFSTGGNVTAPPWIDTDLDRVYIGSYDTKFYTIAISNYSEVRNFANPSDGIHSMCWIDVLSNKPHIYFGDLDGKLWVIDTAGNINPNNWTTFPFQASGPIHSQPIVYNNVVYFGCDDGSFYAIDKNTGKIIWTYNVGGAIYSLPSISIVDNVVVIGTVRGKVYCFYLATSKNKKKANKPSHYVKFQLNNY